MPFYIIGGHNVDVDNKVVAKPCSVSCINRHVIVSTKSPAALHVYDKSDLRDGILYDISTMLGSLKLKLTPGHRERSCISSSFVSLHCLNGACFHVMNPESGEFYEILLPSEVYQNRIAASPWITASRAGSEKMTMNTGACSAGGTVVGYRSTEIFVIKPLSNFEKGSSTKTVSAVLMHLSGYVKGNICNAWAISSEIVAVESTDKQNHTFLNLLHMGSSKSCETMMLSSFDTTEIGHAKNVYYDERTDTMVVQALDYSKHNEGENRFKIGDCFVLKGVMSKLENRASEEVHMQHIVQQKGQEYHISPKAACSLFIHDKNILLKGYNHPEKVEILNFDDYKMLTVSGFSKSEACDPIVDICLDKESPGRERCTDGLGVIVMFASGKIKCINLDRFSEPPRSCTIDSAEMQSSETGDSEFVESFEIILRDMAESMDATVGNEMNSSDDKFNLLSDMGSEEGGVGGDGGVGGNGSGGSGGTGSGGQGSDGGTLLICITFHSII